MYGIIRILLGVALYFGAERIINRSKTNRKRLWAVLSAVFSMVFMVILAFIPFENLFFTFPSAESVYRYYHLGTAKIHLVVEGEECDYVVGSVIGSDRPYMIVPKTEKGWKIDRSLPSPSKLAVQDIVDGVLIHAYRYRNSSDYFIMVCDLEEGIADVSDSNGATFQEMGVGKSLNSNPRKQYYAHLSAPDPDYWIEVNGTVIKPFEAAPEDSDQTDAVENSNQNSTTNSLNSEVSAELDLYFKEVTDKAEPSWKDVQFPIKFQIDFRDKKEPVFTREEAQELGEVFLEGLQKQGKYLDHVIFSITHYKETNIWVFLYKQPGMWGNYLHIVVDGNTGEILRAFAEE